VADILEEYIQRYSNWGRWGPDDELGCLNYITPQKVRQAAALVRQGKVISLALPYDSRGPQSGRFRRINPVLTMLATGTDHLSGAQRLPRGMGYADDMVTMPLQAGTQWDAFSHIFHQGRMWNGFSAGEVTANGAAKCGIHTLRDRIVTRGVLLDVARYKGVDHLQAGYPIGEEDLEGTARAQGVAVEEGDILLVRTGWLAHCRAQGWGDYAGGDAPGLAFQTLPWLFQRRVAGVAADTWGVEVRPNQLPDSFQPWHIVAIVYMGLLVGEIFDLEELAADCASDGVYEFMLVAPPLPFTGAVGSPLNPLAIK
jgi:kynurenine formamidase